jgi:hypothetical protein
LVQALKSNTWNSDRLVAAKSAILSKVRLGALANHQREISRPNLSEMWIPNQKVRPHGPKIEATKRGRHRYWQGRTKNSNLTEDESRLPQVWS